ncbi:MAG: EAL domain-containing protein [Campylobacterota bacterium]
MNLLAKARNLSIQTKLVIPIILIIILSSFVSTQVIENALYKQIFSSQKQEVKSFSNKIYYIMRSNFKTLFYEFGADEKLYNRALDAAQKETLNNIAHAINDTAYHVYIIDHKGQSIALSNFHDMPVSPDERIEEALTPNSVKITQDVFALKREFEPWGWKVVVVRNAQIFNDIISQNQGLIFATIFVMMLGILASIFIITHFIIQKPFKKVFAHLDLIKNNTNEKKLAIESSKETSMLSYHINSMSDAIAAREEQLTVQEQRNIDILNAQESIVIVSDGEKMRWANDAFFAFFTDYSSVEEFTRYHECVCDFFERVEDEEFIYKKEGVNWIKEVKNADHPVKVLVKKEGKEYVFNLKANTIGDKENEYVVNMTDITPIEKYKQQLEQRKEQLTRQLHTDELTKLPNRLTLSEDILQHEKASLIIININDFKELNDFYGTRTGDRILYDFGDFLSRHVRGKSYRVYKLSADEFALYSPASCKRKNIESFASNLLRLITKEDFHSDDGKQKINLTATAGASINDTSHSIFINADIALKTAKKKKKLFLTYQDSLDTKDRFASNIQWADRLKKAFADDRVVPFFQPIFHIKNKRIEKYESLVRLIDEQDRPVSPFFFLDVAKKSHQYLQLTETMIDKSFAFFKDKEYEFSLNLAETDLSDFSINTMLIEKLRQNPAIGPRVVFEILESENIEDYDLVTDFIREVKSYGAKVAIDDFGAGFSNFQHVSKLNVDYLKIDGSLIQNILTDKNSQTIVEAIATFAKRLEIKTIAEFVDDEAILEKIEAMGIDYAQGYLIARPGPAL